MERDPATAGASSVHPALHLPRRFRPSRRAVDLMRRTIFGRATDGELDELGQRVARLRAAAKQHEQERKGER